MKLIAAFAVSLALAACTTMEAPHGCLAGKPAIETQLYFGLSTAHGAVSAREWQTFVEREIAPHFPEGFSVADVRGAWLSEAAKRTIFENSKLLIRVHDGSTKADADIGAVIAAYKREFAQESVMRVDQAVCVAF